MTRRDGLRRGKVAGSVERYEAALLCICREARYKFQPFEGMSCGPAAPNHGVKPRATSIAMPSPMRFARAC